MNKMFKGAVKLGVIAAAGAAAYHYLVPTETKAAMAEKVSDKLEDLGDALVKFENSQSDDEDGDEEDDWGDLSGLLSDVDEEDDDSETDDGETSYHKPDEHEIDPEDHPTASLLMLLAENLRKYADRKWDQVAEEEVHDCEFRR